jgi:hypothetical protein
MTRSTTTLSVDDSSKKSKNSESKKNQKPYYIVSVQKNTALYYKQVDHNKSYQQRLNNSIIEDIVLPEDYE